MIPKTKTEILLQPWANPGFGDPRPTSPHSTEAPMMQLVASICEVLHSLHRLGPRLRWHRWLLRCTRQPLESDLRVPLRSYRRHPKTFPFHNSILFHSFFFILSSSFQWHKVRIFSLAVRKCTKCTSLQSILTMGQGIAVHIPTTHCPLPSFWGETIVTLLAFTGVTWQPL